MMNITIVGGGISGLSLAYFLLEKDPSLNIKVLEAEDRPGGKIWSDRVDGFLCESGANGFLDSLPRTLELADKLFLSPLSSNEVAKKRFIYSRKALHMLPESPRTFLFSKLLTIPGKTRIFYEIFIPRGTSYDETLASFAKRHLGQEAYEKLIDPMASGVFAGDPEKMSLKSSFPRIYELEKTYGSLIRALIKLQRESKKTGKSVGPTPGGSLTSFYDGMECLIQALKRDLGERLLTSKKALKVEKKTDEFILSIADGDIIRSDILIIACPAYEAAEILKDFEPTLSNILTEIPYPALSVVCLGYRLEDIKNNLNGFGFLVPWTERRKILGTLWDSSIFPNRAPDGYVLLRTMVGGARASELAMKDDQSLVDIVCKELNDIMDIHISPSFIRVYRHKKAIPQYNVGHSIRLAKMENNLKKYKWLYLTGNAYKGIALNDCIENSFKLAARIYSEISQYLNSVVV